MVINLQMSIEHALKSFNVTLNKNKLKMFLKKQILNVLQYILVELLHLYSQTIHSMKHVL